MKSRRGHLFLGYWCGLNSVYWNTGNDNYDDQLLTSLAPYTFILGGDLKRVPAYKMAGRVKKRILGRDPHEEAYTRVWDCRAKPIVKSLIAESAETNRPIFFSASALCRNGMSLDLETVLVPVTLGAVGMKAMIGITVPLSDLPESKLSETGERHLKDAGFVFEEAAMPVAEIIRLPRKTMFP